MSFYFHFTQISKKKDNKETTLHYAAQKNNKETTHYYATQKVNKETSA